MKQARGQRDFDSVDHGASNSVNHFANNSARYTPTLYVNNQLVTTERIQTTDDKLQRQDA